MVKNIEFPILRRDLGFSNEREKIELPMLRRDPGALLGVRNRQKSLAIAENDEKSLKSVETLMH